MSSVKQWCDTCAKETTRFSGGGCRSCVSRTGALARNAKHGNPATPESNRMGGLAMVAKYGSSWTDEGRRKGHPHSTETRGKMREAARRRLAHMLVDPRWNDDTHMNAWSKIPVVELQRIADYIWTAENIPFDVRAGLVEAEGMAV